MLFRSTAPLSDRKVPRLRGTFLSLNGAVQNMFSGIAAYLGGLMITLEGGRLIGYGNVGLLAMGATLLAIYFVGRIQMNTPLPAGKAQAGSN